MSFYDLLKYAGTGVASGLSGFDKLKAAAMTGSGGGLPEKTITGTPPLTFTADGTALKAWTMYGNISVSGTPSPTNIIYPSFVGNNYGDEFYYIPVTLGGVTETVTFAWYPLAAIGSYTDSYSGNGDRTQWIEYIELDGNENWGYGATQKCFYCDVPEIYPDYMRSNTDILMICSHYESILQVSSASRVNRDGIVAMYYGSDSRRIYVRDERYDNTTDFKNFLRESWQNQTPVRIWYVMAVPYEFTDEQITLTSIVGSNTLSFGTTVQPSSVSITGNID